jgi:hypothetical protein
VSTAAVIFFLTSCARVVVTSSQTSVLMFDSAVIVGGGRDNQIHGNYFESNDFDILFGNRGNTWQAKIAWCVTHFTVHEQIPVKTIRNHLLYVVG